MFILELTKFRKYLNNYDRAWTTSGQRRTGGGPAQSDEPPKKITDFMYALRFAKNQRRRTGAHYRAKPSATSQHLARMREEGLIDSQRDAQRIHYFIKNEAVNTIIATLKNLYCP